MSVYICAKRLLKSLCLYVRNNSKIGGQRQARWERFRAINKGGSAESLYT